MWNITWLLIGEQLLVGTTPIQIFDFTFTFYILFRAQKTISGRAAQRLILNKL